MTETKQCKCCGSPFKKRQRDSSEQWNSREFCSITCANRAKKPKTPISERFWTHVTPKEKSECWEWQGSTDGRGYGQINNGSGSPVKATRVSWDIHFGPIPDGLAVCHACDNPACVNPDHLLPGTQRANALDMSRKGRMHSNSFLNLRPGQFGFRGAGPTTIKEQLNGISK